MTNWIVGGAIIGFTVFVLIRFIMKARKGQSACCSNGDSSNCSGCCCDSKGE